VRGGKGASSDDDEDVQQVSYGEEEAPVSGSAQGCRSKMSRIIVAW
jgi:hypothetical protein